MPSPYAYNSDPQIEIVDNLFQPAPNPHEDRITAILQKRAQPYSAEQLDLAGRAAANYSIGGNPQGVQKILEAIGSQTDREFESTKALYDLFEEKRAAGDKQATALYEKLKLFTGGDPEGMSMFLEQLHNDPDDIDPTNSFQIMTKLAGISKRTGYKPMDVRLKESQIRASDALATQRKEGGGSGGGSGVTQFVYGKTVKALENAGVQITPQMELQIISAARNGLPKGSTVTVDGQDIAIENLIGVENVLAAQSSAEGFGKKIGEGSGDAIIEERGKAREARQTLASNTEARNLLDSGMITGKFGNFKLEFGKALQAAGINLAADEIANTEAFVANRAQEVGRIIKLFGAGTGLSDADRDYAERAAAGRITLTKESMMKILDISDRAANRTIDYFNEEYSKIPASASPYDLSVEKPNLTQYVDDIGVTDMTDDDILRALEN